VKITTLPATGMLVDNGTAVAAGQFISASDIASGKLTFTPAANANGNAQAAFTFQVQDNGGTASGGVDLDQSANTITFNVTSVNDAPSGTDKTVSTNEDTAYAFTTADFGFGDAADGNSLQAVKITTLPGAGTLFDNGTAVSAGQFVNVADIIAGKLTFAPAANANGNGYAAFTFQVQDNGGTTNGGVDLDQSPNTITVNVAAINDAPSGADKTVGTHDDVTYTFSTSDFGFSDPVEGNALQALKITTLPPTGTLFDNGTAVSAGQFISVADIASGKLTFTPTLNSNGPAAFTFQVQDNGGTANGGVDLDQTPNTMTFNVTRVHHDIPYVVTTLNDELDSTNPNATLAQLGGAGDLSLREALLLAAQDPEGDTITFAPGLSGGTLLVNRNLTEFGFGGNLYIDQNVTINGDINGDGVPDITIDGQNQGRLFFVNSGSVTLQGLTLQHGLAQGGNGGDRSGGGLGAGGAIFVASGADLHIEDIVFDANATHGGNGGGPGDGFFPGFSGAASGGPVFAPAVAPANRQSVSDGGAGGFGAGGGGGTRHHGGVGGFGGGGGAGSGVNGSVGAPGGFGGGSGGNGGFSGNGVGGGGAGLGGSLFVMDGATVTIAGNVSFANGVAQGGTGNQSGSGLGQGLFLQNQAINFAPGAGETITIADTIADVTAAGNASGVNKTGAGTLILSGTNTYTGATTVSGGVLQVDGSVVSAVTVQAGATLDGSRHRRRLDRCERRRTQPRQQSRHLERRQPDTLRGRALQGRDRRHDRGSVRPGQRDRHGRSRRRDAGCLAVRHLQSRDRLRCDIHCCQQ